MLNFHYISNPLYSKTIVVYQFLYYHIDSPLIQPISRHLWYKIILKIWLPVLDL